MTQNLRIIGFDADDTLWQNERFFRTTQERFADLLAGYVATEHLHERLQAAERRNLGHYGFGIKGFTLSMVETAIEVTDGNVPASIIGQILAAGREMLRHPVELLPNARDAVQELAADYRIILITKGDLLDQERKLTQSGLGDLFDEVEIVSAKTQAVYARIFARYTDTPEQAMMVGNSLRSDVIPALMAGAWGVHVPHHPTWALDHAKPPTRQDRFREISDLAELPALIRALN